MKPNANASRRAAKKLAASKLRDFTQMVAILGMDGAGLLINMATERRPRLAIRRAAMPYLIRYLGSSQAERRTLAVAAENGAATLRAR